LYAENWTLSESTGENRDAASMEPKINNFQFTIINFQIIFNA
jgi:hypothetical protein